VGRRRLPISKEINELIKKKGVFVDTATGGKNENQQKPQTGQIPVK